jgi:ketosteroid isomerase-like protein
MHQGQRSHEWVSAAAWKNLGVAESPRVQAIRAAYKAFNEGDIDAVLDLLDERVELHPAATAVEPHPLCGREAVREYLSPNLFEVQSAEPQELIEERDRILVTAHARARGRQSGIEVDQTVFHLLTLEGDRAVRFEVYVERAEALAALRARTD